MPLLLGLLAGIEVRRWKVSFQTGSQLTSSATQAASYIVGVDDVSDFVGAGTVPITVRAVGTGFYNGPGDYSFEVITDAAAEATVVYEYQPPVEDPLGSIGDRVWHDDNQDGIQDVGEVGLEGWTVTLFNDAGAQIGQMPTGPDGLYLFTDLPAGQYRVTVTPQPNWAQTFDLDGVSTAHTALASLAIGEHRRDVDFGYDQTPPPLGSIGDRVWKDIDADGVQEAGEVGLVGWTVTLIRDGSVLSSQNTVADGLYLFDNLPAGTYTVQVTRKAGYTQTFDLDGLLTANVATATLGVGEHRRDVDFGYTCFTACPPAGCGCTPGFWSNRGLGLVRPTDLAVLTSLKLVDATGANADFLSTTTYNFGGTGCANWSTARTKFSQWIGSQNAVNMAAQLSRHLAAFQLNIRYGFISSTRTFSYNGQTYTAVQLVQVANAELCKDQYTPSGDANRAAQERLKNILATANECACR
jgi:hypothetical protein